MSIRRCFVYSIAALAVFTVTSCRSFRYHDLANVCATGSHGNPDKYSPLVCVDVINGIATPLIEPVHVFPHNDKGGQTTIHWKTSSDTSDLKVQLKPGQPECTKQIHCAPGANLCTAVMNPQAQAGWECKYQVWIEGQTQPQDPIIIIDPCCTP